MARRRMIDPNFWQSQDVSRLTIRQRLLAIGLFSLADDEGRGVANPAYVRAMVFPYDDFTSKEIFEEMEAVEKCLEIEIYEVNGNKYYAWKNWRKWQRVDKPNPSILPPPPQNYQNDSKNNSKNDSKNESRNDSKTDSRLKEEKRKEKKRKEEEEKIARARAEETNAAPAAEKDIFSDFENAFGRPLSPIEFEKIKDWQSDYLDEVIREALKRSVLNGKYNMRYIDRILLSWQKNNCRNLREVIEFEKAYEEAKDKHQLVKLQETSAESKIKKSKETISAACQYIKLHLGPDPPRTQAEELAREYGDEFVPAILEELFHSEEVRPP